jgi:O-antigen ligase
VLALFAFVQVIATFRALMDRLYVTKWMAGLGIVLGFFCLGRWRIASSLRREFALLVAILAIAFLAQLGDTLDGRAVALAVSYTITGCASFLIAPCAFRRRSVQRLVWPALLFGVTAGTLLGMYRGLLDSLGSFTAHEGRWRFFGVFFSPNAAGLSALIGLILAAAAFEATRKWRYLVTIPAFLLVMVLADSRESILAAAVLLAVWAMVFTLRWPIRRIAIAASGGALIFLGLLFFVWGRIDLPDPAHLLSALDRWSSGRLEHWSQSLSYLDSPLRWAIGLGLSRNLSFIPEEVSFDVPVRGSNVDNFYVDLLGRAGVLGLLLFLTMAGSLMLRMSRGLRTVSLRGASERAFGIAVLATTLVLGLNNSVILTWAWLQAMVAWPLVGAAAARAESSAAADDRIAMGTPSTMAS